MDLHPSDLMDGITPQPKQYLRSAPIHGVDILPLNRLVDDRGLFLELYRNQATHPGSEALTQFFAGVAVAQLNYSLLTAPDHIKGLHYHLRQSDIWFCPPPFKLKVVILDLRRASPTAGMTQVVVLGDGRDAWVRIPPGVAHGYRALTHPCGLFYLVTECFDLQNPDEYRLPWDHPAVQDLWDIPRG